MTDRSVAEGEPVLRILTWNVWKMFGDPLAVHRVLRAARPDLVCLQEAPGMPWARRQLVALAAACGLHLVAGGRVAAGNAMLRSSRVLVHDAQAVRFRPANRWIQRRGAVLATVALPGGRPVLVAGVHLGLDPAERQDHLQDLIGRLIAARAAHPPAAGPIGGPATSDRLPLVVAGDLNELAGGPSWQALAGLVTDPAPQAPATFTARRPRRRIDAVLTGAGLETLEYGRWCPQPRDALLASDHLPVLALIRPRPAPGSA